MAELLKYLYKKVEYEKIAIITVNQNTEEMKEEKYTSKINELKIISMRAKR